MKVNMFFRTLNMTVQNINMYFGKMYDTLINVECSCDYLGHVVTNKTGYKKADGICQADLANRMCYYPRLVNGCTIEVTVVLILWRKLIHV